LDVAQKGHHQEATRNSIRTLADDEHLNTSEEEEKRFFHRKEKITKEEEKKKKNMSPRGREAQ